MVNPSRSNNIDMIMRSNLTAILLILFFLFSACSSDDDLLPDKDKDKEEENVTPDLYVMSYNIRLANPPSAGSKRDLPAIANIINQSKADLVALQEVDIYTERSGIDIHQAKELGRLTNMNAFFVNAMDVFGGGEYGVAVLSRFPILDSVGYELPTDPSIGGEMRKLAVVKVEMPDKTEITFASTHLDHRSVDNRMFQADLIGRVLQKEKGLVILAGDFNDFPNSRPLDYFDNFLIGTCRNNCPATFPSWNPSSVIDYIMFSPMDRIETVNHQVIYETYPSDHLPVLAGLKINQITNKLND